MADRQIQAGHVLLVDDEPLVRRATEQWLQMAGFAVTSFDSAEAAMPLLQPGFAGILLTDVKMPGMDGLELMRVAREQIAELPVILLTGHGDVDMAIAAMREGAYDFIEKPFVPERLVETIHRACDKRRLQLENLKLQQDLASRSGIDSRLIGISPAITRLKQELVQLASLDANVIVYGETGTGKELVAQCLHELSGRAGKHFVPINCGAVPETLIESELFGHEAGAFTSAAKRRIGKFEYADGGTLFLDEIESMPAHLQIRMLRALQEGIIERLGSNQSIPVDLRVVAASKADLKADENFRDDLFYRLNVAQLHIPPLRQRLEDVPLLFSHYCGKAASAHGCEVRPLSEQDHRTLCGYNWPGNVRELKNTAVRYALDPSARLADLLGTRSTVQISAPVGEKPLSLALQVAAFEADVIRDALQRHQGNIKTVMDELELPRRTLNQKMVKYGINRQDFLADDEGFPQ
mgnify:CR=1 FL=1